MRMLIGSIEFGWLNDDFMQNKTTVALNCMGPYAVKWRKIYITKPSHIYNSIGSLSA